MKKVGNCYLLFLSFSDGNYCPPGTLQTTSHIYPGKVRMLAFLSRLIQQMSATSISANGVNGPACTAGRGQISVRLRSLMPGRVVKATTISMVITEWEKE